MAINKKSNCLLCGSEYDVCKLCQNVIRSNPWRLSCDTPRHYQIYSIVLSLRDGTLKNAEAKEQLDRLKVTAEDIKGFVPSVQATLKPLYTEPAKQEKAEKAQSAAKADNKKSL